MLLATNSTGSHKIKPLIIGHAKDPRCFRGVDMSRIPVIYKYNSKAWMRRDIWESWLSHFNSGFRIQNRQVLLLVDNAPSHVVSSVNDTLSVESSQSSYADFNAFNLSNVTVCFLPPNTTSHIQPLDAGIIKSFKSKYKQHYCRHLLSQVENEIDPER